MFVVYRGTHLHCPPDPWWGDFVGWSCCVGEDSEHSRPGRSHPGWWWRLDLGMTLHFQPYSLTQRQGETSGSLWNKINWQTRIYKVKQFTFLWWGLGGGGGGLGFRRDGGWCSRRFGGAFLQIAVLPANSGVCSVTPGSSVSVGVPAQVPPQVPVERENLNFRTAGIKNLQGSVFYSRN